mgnify:CR=1 FL=1
MFYLTMIDKQTIFISGYEGNMYKTTDGGIIWKNYDFGSEYLKKIIMLNSQNAVSYTHLRAHETVLDLVCRLLLEKKNTYI